MHEGEQGVDGYALWRAQARWGDTGPNGEVRVLEVVTTTPEAYASLWRFLLTVDLTRTVSAWCCAVDEPIQFMVNEPRRLKAGLADGLWLRVMDVPEALAARRYAAHVDVVIEVTDDLIPVNAGRWRLVGGPDGARCESTVDEPDLACDVRALGAAYLGGTPLDALATAGLVREHRPGALAGGGRRVRLAPPAVGTRGVLAWAGPGRVWGYTMAEPVRRRRRVRVADPSAPNAGAEAQTEAVSDDTPAAVGRAGAGGRARPQPRRTGTSRARRRRVVPGVPGRGHAGPRRRPPPAGGSGPVRGGADDRAAQLDSGLGPAPRPPALPIATTSPKLWRTGVR